MQKPAIIEIELAQRGSRRPDADWSVRPIGTEEIVDPLYLPIVKAHFIRVGPYLFAKDDSLSSKQRELAG